MDLRDIIVKQSEPVRVAEAAGTAPGFGTENIAPVFQPLFKQVHAYAQQVTGSEQVRVADLPAVPVAALVHRGRMEDIAEAFEALIRWTTDSGYTLTGTSRELYHHWDEKDPAGHVTELQVLLAASD